MLVLATLEIVYVFEMAWEMGGGLMQTLPPWHTQIFILLEDNQFCFSANLWLVILI
tara:strand:- start:2417 stop:2584 length:168 start_codon:yes stop_codon:yes gene_type:complete